jgi:membrane protein required for colicin V production
MNVIDIVLIFPVLWFAYQGFKRGFIIELASLVALILGIYAALYFSGFAAEFLVDRLNMGPKYVPVVSFIITFVVVVFLVYMVGQVLEKVINVVALGFLNKLAGGVFGLLKAAVFLSIVMMIMNHFNDNYLSEEKKEGSFLYTPIEEIAPFLWEKVKDWDVNDSRIKEVQEDIEKVSI